MAGAGSGFARSGQKKRRQRNVNRAEVLKEIKGGIRDAYPNPLYLADSAVDCIALSVLVRLKRAGVKWE